MHEFRTHQVTSPSLEDNPGYPAWLAAVERGFHSEAPADTFLEHQLKIEASHQSTLRGAWETSPREFGLPAETPVATFTEWQGSINIGGSLVDCHQISDVTVRTSHRRKGILRKLMTDSLTHAHDQKCPLAALTVTEASIYGRFGFGPAIYEQEAELRAGWDFRFDAEPTGSVEYLDVEQLGAAARVVFDKFHATQTGSIGRSDVALDAYTGALTDERKPNRKTRAAGHWNSAGELDGYVTWKPADKPGTVDVIDFVPVDENASLALWSFLASLDLIRRVRFRRARVDEHLPWALTDSRRYQAKGIGDLLWLRVLDPVACLTARNYYSDGDVSLRVVDHMGLANGTWQLSVRNGTASMDPTGDADVELDVRALGSALLGGVNLQALATAGQVRGKKSAIDELGILLGRRRSPWCLTPF